MDEIQTIIFQTALAAGIDPFLALAVAQQESGFNPQAVGDGGYSFGLFQENTAGGAGSTYLNNGGSYEDFFDPVSATQRFAERIKWAMQNLGPDATPGEIGYAAQRPADREGYTSKINSLYGSLGGSAPGGGEALVAREYDPGLFGEDGGDQPQQEDFWSWVAGIPGAVGGAVGGALGGLFGGGGADASAPPEDLPPVPGSESKGAPIHYQSLGSGRILLTYADGTTEVKDYGTSGTTASGGSTAASTRVVNLGGGRYLAIGADGTVQERNFGGGAGGTTGGAAAANPFTPPSLDPSRSKIVAYLQALLGQNALPYNAVGGGGAATPSVAAPPAVPALTAPPSLAAPALGGGQTMVNVAGAPSPIDISGGAFAQQPQNFLAALNPAQSVPRTFAPPQIGTPLPAPQMAAPLAAPAPTPYPQDLLRNKLPGLY